MSRRPTRIVYTSSSSSSSDDEPHPNPNQNDDVSSPISTLPSQQPMPNISSVTLNCPCPIQAHLAKLGLSLKPEWINTCLLTLQNSVPQFLTLDVETKAKLCFGQFLFSDLNCVGAGGLPNNVGQLHGVDLPGPFVLQVDEIINVTCTLKERYKEANAGHKRCLKFSMTDGVQRVFGMEYRPIPNPILAKLGPAGFKVAVRNVNVRRGILMLVPEVLEVLGGSVEELEEARQRLINELNKPPRGRRSRTGDALPLSTRAALAAWPQRGVNGDPVLVDQTNRMPGNNSNSTNNAAAPNQAGFHGADITTRTRQTRPFGHISSDIMPQTDQRRESTRHSTGETAQQPTGVGITELQMGREATERPPTERTRFSSISTTIYQNESHMQATEPRSIETISSTSTNRIETEDMFVEAPDPPPSEISRLSSFSASATEIEDVHMEIAESPFRERARLSSMSSATIENVDLDGEAAEPPPSESTRLSSISSTTFENDEVHMSDHVEHPFILRGQRQLPFTYLSSLSAQLTAVVDREPVVRGKIKCFVTGVKSFQYRDSPLFELRVYVDDGSLISEILIHHDVVQREVRYSPQEVTSGLVSPDKEVVTNMRNTLLKFQAFLVKFEGIILVEMNNTSAVPVALEMSPGCFTADAWLLLQRLKPAASNQLHQNDQLNMIDLSP